MLVLGLYLNYVGVQISAHVQKVELQKVEWQKVELQKVERSKGRTIKR